MGAIAIQSSGYRILPEADSAVADRNYAMSEDAAILLEVGYSAADQKQILENSSTERNDFTSAAFGLRFSLPHERRCVPFGG
ncbi:MAG TPA: hypothetical protein VIX59_16910 [Candidatus Binataceae bacterium]